MTLANHKLTLPFIMGCLFLVQTQLNLQLRFLDTAWVEPPSEMQDKINPRLISAMVFGQVPVAVDWYILRSLVDTTLTHVAPGKHNILYYYLDLVTELDPQSLDLYLWGGNLAAVLHKDGVGARNLLLKGETFSRNQLASYPVEFKEKYWSLSWRLNALLAYVYLFELNDMPHAAEAFTAASQIAGAPPYLQRIAQKFARPAGKYEVALKLLKFLEEVNKDDRIREEYERKYSNLYVGQYLFELNDEFVRFLNSRPDYRKNASPSHRDMGGYWKEFLQARNMTDQDPWKGKLSMSPVGKIVSTTPHESIYGLE